MPINTAWAELVGFSSPKANAMTIVGYTGTEISALSSTAVDGQIVYCYQSGSIYVRGHWYGWDDQLAGGTWVDLVMLPSLYEHFASDEYAFQGVVIDKRSSQHQEYNYNDSGTAGASVGDVMTDNSTQYINLTTGTVSTGWASLYAGGPLLDWGKPAMLAVKFRTSSGAVTGQINKLGINIDRAGLGPSTRRNVGVEWCDGDTSFQIHSGNGTNQSNFDTQITVVANTIYSIKLYFDPGNEVKVIFDDGTTVTEKIKNTFVPSSGTSTSDGLIKLSISNNAGNTTSRNLDIFAAYLVYGTNDTVWS